MFNSSQDATDAASASQSSATFTMGGGSAKTFVLVTLPIRLTPNKTTWTNAPQMLHKCKMYNGLSFRAVFTILVWKICCQVLIVWHDHSKCCTALLSCWVFHRKRVKYKAILALFVLLLSATLAFLFWRNLFSMLWSSIVNHCYPVALLFIFYSLYISELGHQRLKVVNVVQCSLDIFRKLLQVNLTQF